MPQRSAHDGDPLWTALIELGATLTADRDGTIVALPPGVLDTIPDDGPAGALLARCRTARRLAWAASHPLTLCDTTTSIGPLPWIMGILNVTPDSFSDGGRFIDHDIAVAHAQTMAAGGARIIDVGGESTRPGAPAVAEADELTRVVPIVAALRGALPPEIVISIDTFKAPVAAAAIEAGATMINDVTAGADPGMARVVADTGAAWVLMHMQGTPRTMQSDPAYGDVVGDVALALEGRLAAAADAGVQFAQLLLDPGIGFGKTVAHNCELHARLGELRALGRPLLCGPSRKSFLGALLAGPGAPPAPVGDRLEGTLAAVTAAVLQGALILRVHDVAEAARAVRVAAALRPEAGL